MVSQGRHLATHTALGVRSELLAGGTLLRATITWVIDDGTELLNHLDFPLYLLLKVSIINKLGIDTLTSYLESLGMMVLAPSSYASA
jgi:hypothetical protein